MSIAIITGSAGLIGSESVRHFASLGLDTVGIDNDMRSYFFGAEASTKWMRDQLETEIEGYRHHSADIRDRETINQIFSTFGDDIAVVVHTASQPSHDWAAREPHTDFEINATGTLNLLEACRRHCPEAAFIFTSTNKVYGDTPNRLPLAETRTRWEIAADHPYRNGIPESMTVDQSKHSLFGASKVAADIYVQEYGRYFGLNTVSFRGGCLTGPNHSGAELHGFLAYLMRCTATGRPYTVFGYKGKQVRDNIHSADLIAAFDAYFQRPIPAAVYNIGGGRQSNVSMLEAVAMCEEITGNRLDYSLSDEARQGDHIWYVSDLDAFKGDYPDWDITVDVPDILEEMFQANKTRWDRE